MQRSVVYCFTSRLDAPPPIPWNLAIQSSLKDQWVAYMLIEIRLVNKRFWKQGKSRGQDRVRKVGGLPKRAWGGGCPARDSTTKVYAFSNNQVSPLSLPYPRPHL